jgi:2-polyprenyl-3-methyl-5-hydroxy-6-metoxy-1,4-benzoquinol methylase
MAVTRTALNDLSRGDQIRSRSCPSCSTCGAEGDFLYRGLKDRYFAAPGIWDLKKCKNSSCGQVWLDPMPIGEDIGKAYLTYFTHSDETVEGARDTLPRRLMQAIGVSYLAYTYGYGNGKVSVLGKALGLLAYLVPPRRARLDFSVMYLSCIPCGRLLEVGCGSGSMLKGMADLGWRVQGIDFDPAAVENSKRKGLEVHLGTLGAIRYPENYFDAVTMSHLVEHVQDPLELLKECHRILKPSGRLSLVTPNLNSAGHRIHGSSWFHLDPPRHLQIFTLDSLKLLLTEASFRKISTCTTIRDASTVFVASRSIQRTGKYEIGVRKPRYVRAWGRAIQAIEWAWLRLDRQAGEEIVAIAQK